MYGPCVEDLLPLYQADRPCFAIVALFCLSLPNALCCVYYLPIQLYALIIEILPYVAQCLDQSRNGSFDVNVYDDGLVAKCKARGRSSP